MAFNFSVVKVDPIDHPSPGLSVVAAELTRREPSRGILRYRLLQEPPLQSVFRLSSAS